MKKKWKLYILHFQIRYKHAQHYIGITNNVAERNKRHIAGDAARLTQILKENKINFTMYILAEFDDYTDAHNHEKKLKRMGGGRRNCPYCNGNKNFIDIL